MGPVIRRGWGVSEASAARRVTRNSCQEFLVTKPWWMDIDKRNTASERATKTSASVRVR
jgi:hypothetical protein